MTIEKTLFAANDKMRGSMDPSEYKHVALNQIFEAHDKVWRSQVSKTV